MARLLEELESGTAVHTGPDGKVGEVRAVYASGQSRAAQYLLVYWLDIEDATLLDADEVLTISDDGILLRSSRRIYSDLPAFRPESNPMLHRLK